MTTNQYLIPIIDCIGIYENLDNDCFFQDLPIMLVEPGLAGWRKLFKQKLPEQESIVIFIQAKRLFDQSDLNSFLEEVLLSATKAVLIYSDRDSTLMSMNILYDKIANEYADMLPIWEAREKLSYELFNNFKSQAEPEFISNFNNIKSLKINIRYVKNSIQTILDYVGLHNYSVNRVNSFSKHIHKDILINKIISSTVNNVYFEWDNSLSLVDQAYIQYLLRDQYNFELKCYNLNDFPTNSKYLSELLIRAN